jgi:hypothetical protein
MLRSLTIAFLIAVSTAASAQHQHQPASPYSGFEQRPIKALSAQQVADLQAGRGMGPTRSASAFSALSMR